MPAGASIDHVGRSEAIDLFVERARAVLPSFALTDHNGPAVAEVCQRLDGMPLAVELAAARVALLAPEQLVARLDDCFRLLSAGSRSAPTRQQTLRATVAWSYDLLYRGDFGAAWALGTDALTLWRRLGNDWQAARALFQLGALTRMEGNFAGARTLLQEAAALLRPHPQGV